MTRQKKINILRVNHLRGPNIWTYRAVIEAWVDIGALEDFPSNTLPGFYERLTGFLPGLIEHECSPGVRGGFLQRLEEGTWAAHILEHVCLELQNMAGMRTGFGKARKLAFTKWLFAPGRKMWADVRCIWGAIWWKPPSTTRLLM